MDLEKFGLPEDEKSLSGADITLKDLKDAVQLSLVQQSEYLRRFALAFSDKVREEGQEMDRDGLLKQVGMLLKLSIMSKGRLIITLDFFTAGPGSDQYAEAHQFQAY